MIEIRKRVAVFFDGSNFFHKMRDLKISNLSYYDYRGLSNWLAGERDIKSIGYYIAVVRAQENDKKGQKMRWAQIKLFNHFSSPRQQVRVHRGYLMKNDGVYHEKGVDVKIATDLLVGAYENLYDDAIVISSDTDLIPAMDKIKKLGKNVEYVGFGHQPTLALQTVATRSRLLLVEDLKKFVSSYFIIIRGPLGCGKSTIAEKLSKVLNAEHISIDKVFEEHGLDKTDSEAECIPSENFIKANEIILPDAKNKLQNGRVVIFDACFYHKEPIEDLIQKLSFPHFIFTLKAPVEVCIDRDSKRDKVYGEDAARAVHTLVSRLDCGVVINATKPLDKIIEEILSYLPKQ